MHVSLLYLIQYHVYMHTHKSMQMSPKLRSIEHDIGYEYAVYYLAHTYFNTKLSSMHPCGSVIFIFDTLSTFYLSMHTASVGIRILSLGFRHACGTEYRMYHTCYTYTYYRI